MTMTIGERAGVMPRRPSLAAVRDGSGEAVEALERDRVILASLPSSSAGRIDPGRLVGESPNPQALKPYVDLARKVGFNTFLAVGGVSLAGILGGIVTCAFNPPLGLALLGGSALINAAAAGTMILLAREDSVADACKRAALATE